VHQPPNGFSVIDRSISNGRGAFTLRVEKNASNTPTTMKHVLKIALLMASFAMTACSEPKPRDFFAARGITIGAPAAIEPSSYRIPIKFDTKIVHSGQWIDAVSAKVSGSDILVTATFTSANRKSGYPGHVEVKGIPAGTCTLKYRDPDGTTHPIGPVVLP
jgi:hypothetical protein